MSDSTPIDDDGDIDDQEVEATVKVRDVTFSGSGQFTVAPDPGDTFPTDPPHWLDENLDGDTDDAGDRTLPVGFVRNTQVYLSANFAVGGPGVGMIDPSGVRVRGDGPGNLDMAATTALYDGARQSIYLTPTALTSLLPNSVQYFEQFSVAWEVSLDGGATWSSAGTSANQAYVSLATPALETVRHTQSLSGKVMVS